MADTSSLTQFSRRVFEPYSQHALSIARLPASATRHCRFRRERKLIGFAVGVQPEWSAFVNGAFHDHRPGEVSIFFEIARVSTRAAK